MAQAVNDQVDYGRDVRRNADLTDILIVSLILAQALAGSVWRADNPGGLRGARQAYPVALEDRLLAIQRQRIDVFAGDQVREHSRCRIRLR